MLAIAALLARPRLRFGVVAVARGSRSLSASPAMRKGCQPASQAGPGGGSGGSGAGRQSVAAAFLTQHPVAALGGIAAGGAFLFGEIRTTRSELFGEMRATRSELKQELRQVNERMNNILEILAARGTARQRRAPRRGSGTPRGEAAPGDASGGGAAA